MSEIERFTTAQTSLDQYRQSVGLELGKRMEIPFTGGEIIYAQTESGLAVVVKRTLRKEQAEHEWIGLNIVYPTGVSVPSPIALINYDQNQLAIVSTQVDGNNLYFYPNPEVKAEMGKQIKTMHQLAKVDGKMWESSGRSSFTYYDKYMFNWSRGGLEDLGVGSETHQLLTALTQNVEQFCKESLPVFNHNDLHDGQIIVDNNNSPTIIDFGNWTEETWLNDIGYYLFHLIRTGRDKGDDFLIFLDGYRGSEKLSDSEKSNLSFYLLFISSRALTYFYRSRSSYLPTAKETHNRVLAYIDNEESWKAY